MGRKGETLWTKQTLSGPTHGLFTRLSPCDFWPFGTLKHRMTDRQLQSPKEILDAVTELWDEVTFEELQNVFLAWMERLQWVIQNSGEYFIN